MSNKFKTDNGIWLTTSLFWELCLPADRKHCMYTLRDEDLERDGKVFPSLRKAYMDLEDPTEYDFANKFFGGWQHWLKLTKSKEIAKTVEEWREELEVKLRAQGIKAIIHKAQNGEYQSSKYLSDKGWGSKTRGAPTKEEKARERKIASKVSNVIDMDYDRLLK